MSCLKSDEVATAWLNNEAVRKAIHADTVSLSARTIFRSRPLIHIP